MELWAMIWLVVNSLLDTVVFVRRASFDDLCARMDDQFAHGNAWPW